MKSLLLASGDKNLLNQKILNGCALSQRTSYVQTKKNGKYSTITTEGIMEKKEKNKNKQTTDLMNLSTKMFADIL